MSHTPLLEGAALARKYSEIRQATESLCAPLNPEDMTVQPVEDVSPPKWHLGHTTWFFEELILTDNNPGYIIFDPAFAWFFNSYYETKGERLVRAMRGNMTRPSTDMILAYRKHVDEAVRKFLSGELSPELIYLFNLGLHHEQQHQELLCYDIQFILGHNPLFPVHSADGSKKMISGTAPEGWLKIPEGLYEAGAEPGGFAFDNEYERHTVFLREFSIGNRPVSNAEYLEFMLDGGYDDFHHWLMEGIEWARKEKIDSPLYWHKVDGRWHRYSLHGLEPVDPAETLCNISYYEADAFARWKGCRLPTEVEWEVACAVHQPEIPDAAALFTPGKLKPGTSGKDSDYGFYGGAWEWTGSAYLPYPGFRTAPGAVGEYNGKFMVSQMVLRGGSWATPRDHIRPTYRNFFHPGKRWQTAGIRLAKDE